MRVGSRGMVWLEPLVEVEDASGQRIGYGPVTADDVPGLVQAGLFEARTASRCAWDASKTCPSSRSRSA